MVGVDTPINIENKNDQTDNIYKTIQTVENKDKDPIRSVLVDVHSPAPCVVVIRSGLAGVWMRKRSNRR